VSALIDHCKVTKLILDSAKILVGGFGFAGNEEAAASNSSLNSEGP